MHSNILPLGCCCLHFELKSTFCCCCCRNQSILGTIDDLRNISAHQLYFYRGTHDTCYKTGTEESTLSFYSRITLDRGTDNHVAYRGDVGSDHAQPTGPRYPGEPEWGGPCGGRGQGKGTGPWSYIEACEYDGAGGVLKHMYGDAKYVSALVSGLANRTRPFLVLPNAHIVLGSVDHIDYSSSFTSSGMMQTDSSSPLALPTVRTC